MSLKRNFKGFPPGLFFRIICINVISVLFAVVFMVGFLFLEYKNQEKTIAKEKLLKYWILENNRLLDSNTNAIIQRSYLQDIESSLVGYGLRIVDNNNNPILFLFPNEWIRYNMYNIIFPTNYDTVQSGVKLFVNGSLSDTKKAAMISMYSINVEARIIQILISSEERRSFTKHMADNGVAVIIFTGILSSIAAFVILRSIMLPIYRINALAEYIIDKQRITERLPESKIKNKKGEFIRLEKNINKMLDTIERLVKRLQFANISLGHDIRTPLTHIKNNCETLFPVIQKKESRNKLEACMVAVKDIQQLTKNMLNLSEIESGLVKIPKEPVHINAVLEGIIEMYTYVAEEHKIQFDVSIVKNMCVYLDAIWLRQLVGNLLDNAMKFTPSGKRVVLNALIRDEQVCITVGDEGVGIADKDIPHIWETAWKKNKKVHVSKNKDMTESQSSGFGLSIVKSIVLAYRGTIAVSSTLGRGTVFTIKFKT